MFVNNVFVDDSRLLGVINMIYSINEVKYKKIESPEMARKLIGHFFKFVDPPRRHLHREISASVDEGLSGGSSVRRPGSEGSHQHQHNFSFFFLSEVLTFLPERRQLGFQIVVVPS